MPTTIDVKVRNTPADAKNVENLWFNVLEAKEAALASASAEMGDNGKKLRKGKKNVFRPLTDGH